MTMEWEPIENERDVLLRRIEEAKNWGDEILEEEFLKDLKAIADHYKQIGEIWGSISGRPLDEQQKARDLLRAAVLERVLSQTTTETELIGG